MTNQSPLSPDEVLWDELLHSEASKKFLDRLIEQAQEELQQDRRGEEKNDLVD